MLIREFKQNSITTISEQSSKCLGDIKAFRREIDSFLDQAEKEAINSWIEYEADAIKEATEACQRVGININVTQQTLEELKSVKRLATNFQTYSSLRLIRNFVSEQKTETRCIEEKGHLLVRRLWMKRNPILSNFDDTIGCLAQLGLTKEENKLELEDLETDQQQASLHTVSKHTARTRSIVSKQSIGIYKHGNFDISGCQILSNGDLIFVNKREQLLLK